MMAKFEVNKIKLDLTLYNDSASSIDNIKNIII